MPILLFVSVAEAVTLDTLKAWWPLIANSMFSMLVGYGLGRLEIYVLNPPVHLRNLVLGGMMMGNTGNLPLVLVAAIAQDEKAIFGAGGESTGIAYVAVNMVGGLGG